MILDSAYAQFKQAKEGALKWLQEEAAGLRSGRVATDLVARLPVELYGTRTPLQGLASIIKVDARTLTVTPWDTSALVPIEKALVAAHIGAQPMVDGKVVRLVFASLTEEERERTVKRLHQLAEEARVRVRVGRDTALKAVREAKEAGELTEDDFYKGRERLDELARGANEEIVAVVKSKEEDIRSV